MDARYKAVRKLLASKAHKQAMNKKYRSVAGLGPGLSFDQFLIRWKDDSIHDGVNFDDALAAVIEIVEKRSRDVELAIANASVRNNPLAAFGAKLTGGFAKRRQAKQMAGFEIDAPFENPLDDDEDDEL
jgi:hypothetical protein